MAHIGLAQPRGHCERADERLSRSQKRQPPDDRVQAHRDDARDRMPHAKRQPVGHERADACEAQRILHPVGHLEAELAGTMSERGLDHEGERQQREQRERGCADSSELRQHPGSRRARTTGSAATGASGSQAAARPSTAARTPRTRLR